jgi:hypothetical protein
VIVELSNVLALNDDHINRHVNAGGDIFGQPEVRLQVILALRGYRLALIVAPLQNSGILTIDS